jgi:amidohydrolase
VQLRPPDQAVQCPTMAGGTLELVTRVRRQLHREPELGHEEWRTADLVESELRDLRLQPWRPAPTSIAVVVGPEGVAPQIAFRADLDALPIREEGGAPYASTVPGVMHACGHDGHAAALVGVASVLVREGLNRSALLMFQQAEESHPSGAPLVLDGLAGQALPAEFFAFHLWPQLEAGSVALREGPMLGAVAGVEIRIDGALGRTHGTEVASGTIDALSAGVSLYAELVRSFGSGRLLRDDPGRSLSIGRFDAGSSPNSTPVRCTLEATLRSVSWAAQEEALAEIAGLVKELSARTGASVTTHVVPDIRPPVVNDAASTTRVRDACSRIGLDCVDYPEQPLAVSDDFGWFIDGRPGALVFVGCGTDERRSDLHTPTFDFDESVLMNIVQVAVELTRTAQG